MCHDDCRNVESGVLGFKYSSEIQLSIDPVTSQILRSEEKRHIGLTPLSQKASS